ncbi:peptidylprolyl isomerase [Huintestinicola sp.]|uniref:peptidylprolyl isomerase n=1 Tax=Huintestinicola sp. TaxID=2981661 RepID=UPI003D7D9CAF
MKIKNIKNLAALAVSAVMLCACGGQTENTASDTEQTSAANTTVTNAEEGPLYNFEMPEVGEKIAVITVKDFGEIKIKLFPEQAQKGVENFVGLAEMNYYDELIFHRIISHFMNQGGDPTGTGTGGKSIWGDKFDGGIPEGLYHFSGAVAYANSGSTATNGSQFYIVNTDPGEFELGGTYLEDGSIYKYQTFEEAGFTHPKNVQEMYKEKGGTPFLDGSYTVFGQVFEGMDVVRAMGQVETDENDKPLTQVQMESVRIVEYTGE